MGILSRCCAPLSFLLASIWFLWPWTARAETALNTIGGAVGVRLTGFETGVLGRSSTDYPSGASWLWQLPSTGGPMALANLGQSLEFSRGPSREVVELIGEATRLRGEGFLSVDAGLTMDVGLGSVPSGNGRYLMVFGSPGNRTISVLEIEAGSDGKPVVKTFGIAKDATLNQSATLGLIGVGAQPNPGLVVTGDATSTYLFNYNAASSGNRISNPAGTRVGNHPSNFVFLSAGPGPEPASFFVAGINTESGSRKVQLRYLKDGSYQGGVILEFAVATPDFVIPVWDPYSPGNVVFAVYQAGATRVRVYRGLNGESLNATAAVENGNSGLDLRASKAAPLVLAPFAGEMAGFIVGRKQGESSFKLWRVNLTSGAIQPQGQEFGTQPHQTIVPELPDVSVGVEALDRVPVPAGQAARFRVFRQGAIVGDLDVSYQTGSEDQSAAPGGDFEPGPGTVRIQSGQSETVLSMPLKVLEGCKNERSFFVQLSGLPIAAGQGRATSRIALTSNCAITIRPEEKSISPGERAQYTVERGGDVSGAYDAGYQVTAGPGTSPGDFGVVDTESPLRFTSGQSTKVITVEAAATSEECRTSRVFTVTVMAASSNTTGKSATGIISAVTQRCLVTLVGPGAVVSPGQDAVFAIRREGTSAAVDQTVTYGITANTTSDGRWQKGVDYLDPLGGTLSFRAGDQVKEVRITVLTPPVCRNARTFDLTLTGFGSSARSTVDSLMRCQMGITPAAVTMDPGGNARYSVSRDGDLSSPLDAAFTVNPGAGTGLGDFTAPASPLRFSPGEATRTLQVDAASTSEECRTARSFVISVPGGVSATGTINARTNCPFTLSGPAQTVSPNQDAVFFLERSGTAVQQEQTFVYSVEANAKDGRWEKGLDYQDQGNGSAKLLAGESRREIRIGILDPRVCRSARSFSVKVTSPSAVQAPGTVAALSSCNVSIAPSTVTVNPGQTASFTVGRDGDVSGPYQTDTSVTPQTGTSPSDFTAPSGPLTFQANQATRPFLVDATPSSETCRTQRGFVVTLANGKTANGTISAVTSGCTVEGKVVSQAAVPILPGDGATVKVDGDPSAFDLGSTRWTVSELSPELYEISNGGRGQEVVIRVFAPTTGAVAVSYAVPGRSGGLSVQGSLTLEQVADPAKLVRLEGPTQVLAGEPRRYSILWKGDPGRSTSWLNGREIVFRVDSTSCSKSTATSSFCTFSGTPGSSSTMTAEMKLLTADGQARVLSLVDLDVLRVAVPSVGGTTALRFLPVALESPGVNNAFFETELTLANRTSGAVTVEIELGTVKQTEVLAAGTQQIIGGVVERLREADPSLGVFVGPLNVSFKNCNDTSKVDVLARTQTPSGTSQAYSTRGRAGLAYRGLRLEELFGDPEGVPSLSKKALLAGLRGISGNPSLSVDRSNLALVNPFTDPVTVDVAFFDASGTQVFRESKQVAGKTVHQYSNLPVFAGSTEVSYATVDWLEGSGFYAYATPVNNTSNDGSFVFPVPDTGSGTDALLVPVVLEVDGRYYSDLSLTVPGAETSRVVADYYWNGDVPVSITRQVMGGELLGSSQDPGGALTGLVRYLASDGSGNVPGAAGPTYLGPLIVRKENGEDILPGELIVGSRVDILAAGDPGGSRDGRFGIFLPAVALASLRNVAEMQVLGLQRTPGESGVRSNLALVNPSETEMKLKIEIFSGRDGSRKALAPGSCGTDTNGVLTLPPRKFCQMNDVLGLLDTGTEPIPDSGYAVITRTQSETASLPFMAYGVINDNLTNDGAYLVPGVTSCESTIRISEPDLTSLPAAQLGQAYGPVTFRAVPSGRGFKWTTTGLPAGMTFTANSSDASQAVLTGTPTQTQTAKSLVVTVTDSIGCHVDRTYDFAVDSGRYTLKVTKAGNGTGTVTSTPDGISCGPACSGPFGQGQTVKLTASADSGSSFSSWTGCDSTAANQCSVAMNANREVTVTFDATPECTNFSFSPSSDTSVPSGGGSRSFSIIPFPSGTNCVVSAASSNGWITEISAGGSMVYYIVAANTGPSRTGSIVVTKGTVSRAFTVTQLGAGCTDFSFSPSSDPNIPRDGGSRSFTIVPSPSGASCQVSASSPYNWITQVSVGPSTVYYIVAANSGATRTGSITVTKGAVTKYFSVTQQSGATCSGVYTLDPTYGVYSKVGGGYSFRVVTDTSCSWTATTSYSWIHVTTVSGTGTSNVYFTLDYNYGAARTGSIIAGGKTFTVTQGGSVVRPGDPGE